MPVSVPPAAVSTAYCVPPPPPDKTSTCKWPFESTNISRMFPPASVPAIESVFVGPAVPVVPITFGKSVVFVSMLPVFVFDVL